MNDDERQRQTEWADATQWWFEVVGSALPAHAIEEAAGRRGVLVIKIEVQDMETMLTARIEGREPVFGHLTTWIPADDFVDGIRKTFDDQEAWRRWQAPLQSMDPSRDVAVFLLNNPRLDPTGYQFSRFLVVPGKPKDVTVDSSSAFFESYRRFISEHEQCPDGPEHLRLVVWLPKSQEVSAVAITCICGSRVVLDGTQSEGRAIVAATRLAGLSVSAHDGPERIQ